MMFSMVARPHRHYQKGSEHGVLPLSMVFIPPLGVLNALFIVATAHRNQKEEVTAPFEGLWSLATHKRRFGHKQPSLLYLGECSVLHICLCAFVVFEHKNNVA